MAGLYHIERGYGRAGRKVGIRLGAGGLATA